MDNVASRATEPLLSLYLGIAVNGVNAFMDQVICHIGMPKTGTTSIQSTLFWNLPWQSFRCLTLDTSFGNRNLTTAFTDYQRKARFYVAAMPQNRWDRLSKKSRVYFSRCLKNARREGWTPVLSAEAISRFNGKSLEKFKCFMEEHGFAPRVVVYMRSPLDLLDSRVQQKIRTGLGLPLDVLKIPYDMSRLKLIDEVFGRENVSAYYFNPSDFPNRCVVTHFLENVGIHLDPDRIIRENESLKRDALAFLHLSNSAGNLKKRQLIPRVQRQMLIRYLQNLRGEALRLHPSVSHSWVMKFQDDLPWLEQRLGCAVPLSSVDRSQVKCLRSLDELQTFSGESLDWLASTTGGQQIRGHSGPEVNDWVLKRLQRLNLVRHPINAGQNVKEHFRRVRHRNKMKTQLLS